MVKFRFQHFWCSKVVVLYLADLCSVFLLQYAFWTNQLKVVHSENCGDNWISYMMTYKLLLLEINACIWTYVYTLFMKSLRSACQGKELIRPYLTWKMKCSKSALYVKQTLFYPCVKFQAISESILLWFDKIFFMLSYSHSSVLTLYVH